MADVITRLKLESGEYDSKIKRAVTGLQRMEDECRKVGGTLAILEKDQKEYVQSLGRMQTVSTSVRGKIGELSSAYVELRAQYNRLTQEEKKGDFGKALSASLDQLKTRIGDSKKELNDINAELGNMGKASNGTGGFVDALTQKLTINFDALTMLNKGLGLASQALDVAKEAFFSSEANVDAWGRTIASNESLYRSFLTALNNSDISGFLGRIDQIIDAARKAYDELDRLGTMKTIQGPAVSAQQTENERMRMMIQTGRYIAPVDGRRASMANGTMLTPDQIRSIEQKLQQGMTKIVSLTSNEVKQTGRAIDAVYNRMAKENNMSMREFRKGTSSMAEFDKRMKGYEQYQKYEREHTITSNRYIPQTGDYDTFTYRDQTKNPYQQYRNWGTFRVDAMGKGSYNELVDLIRQRDQQAAQAYGMQSQAFRTMNRAEGMTVSKIMRGETAGTTGGGSGRGGGKNTPKVEEVFPEGSMKDLQRDMQELKKAQDLVTSPDEWQKYQQQIDAVTEKMNTLKGVVKQAPEMAEGVSGLNQKAIATYQSMLQESMKGMEYGSTDLTKTLANSIDVTTLSNLLKTTLDQGLDITKMKFENGSPIIEELWNTILSGENIPDKAWEELGATISEELKKRGGKGIKINTATGNVGDEEKQEQVDTLQQMQKLNSGLSSVNSGLQQIGIKLPDGMQKMLTVMQGVTSVIQGVQTVISVFSTSSQSANTAAVMANTGTMTALIAALTANTAALSVNTTANFIPFATGGIVHAAGGVMVPGNSFSGDRVPALLNSGELVLNKAQQYNLASQLEGESNQGGGAPMLPYVSGDKIILGANNFLKGAGKGELVTTSYLRQKGLI